MYKYVQNELRLPNMLREGSVTKCTCAHRYSDSKQGNLGSGHGHGVDNGLGVPRPRAFRPTGVGFGGEIHILENSTS
jgi:hypothetical protein